MKKIFFKTLKGLALLFILFLLAFGVLYLYHVNYSTYSLQAEVAHFPKVKTEKDMNELAKKLVEEMSLEEKMDQLSGGSQFNVISKMLINFVIKRRFPHVYIGRNERLHIPPWVLSDGPRGARVMDKKIKAVTTFPVAMARGASWDIDLERRVHEVIAMEMRANGTNYAATPCINLLRHPGWGRAQETYGEDPWHLGEFGVVAVQALEQHQVMACPKHFALNSIDNSRWVLNVEVDDRTLREVYLPHFKKTIQKGKPASLMSAYNQINGTFCGSNKKLLTTILREEWGFEGFISTDWLYGIYDGVAGIKAGLDVEMPWKKAYSYKVLKKGIKDGEITEADIDKIVERSLRTRLKYAFVNDNKEYPLSLVAQESHIHLAKEVAEKTMVLLKNENILPFTKSANKKIAVIGRLANLMNTGDKGSSDSTPPYVVTPYQGIKKYHESLGNEVMLYDGSDLSIARKMATEADELIVVVGFTYEDEGEYMIMSRDKMNESAKAKKLIGKKGLGGDRESLKLLAADEALIEALVGTNKKLVVSYVGGSAIDMSAWADKVPAILFTWYSGMEGGNALASILYGDVNPSGKLLFSIAKNEKDYPYFNPYIDKITYGYYHGYTLFDKKDIEVKYPFGFGLSYTNYEYSNLQIQSTEIDKNGKMVVSVDIKNTGKIKGEEIVQLYIGYENSAVERPVKLLRDFKKVALQANESKTILLEVAAKDLAWYNPIAKQWEVETMEYEIYVGPSSSKEDLIKANFSVR